MVDQVLSPTLGDEQTRAGLTSEDKQVALILVRFSAIGTEPVTKEAMAAIAGAAGPRRPQASQAYMTGDGPILGAYNDGSKESIDSTTWITILLVVVILLLIYRSPVSPLIPLVTIALAYLISRGVVALLGAHVLTISMYTNVFLIVVLFGAGTDYCLFLISRFREEMAGRRARPAPAVKTTVRAVGETIASSAGTVIVGLAMMAVAELGLYNTSGPSIAIGVAIALLAGLTLTPALLTILGDHAFWPRKARHMKEARHLARLGGQGGQQARRRPPGAGDRAGAAGRLRQRPGPRLRPAGRPPQGRRGPAWASTCWPTHLGAGHDAAPQRGGRRPGRLRHPGGAGAHRRSCRRSWPSSPT